MKRWKLPKDEKDESEKAAKEWSREDQGKPPSAVVAKLKKRMILHMRKLTKETDGSTRISVLKKDLLIRKWLRLKKN